MPFFLKRERQKERKKGRKKESQNVYGYEYRVRQATGVCVHC